MRISDWSSDVCSSDLMPTGDITAAIAGALLRTKVPADDIAIRIEHEDRVVLDAIDKQAEALLAQTQQFLLLASLAEITRDFGEAAKFAAVVDQPRDDDVRPECRSEEHTSELQSLMRISYAVFCSKKKKNLNSIQK